MVDATIIWSLVVAIIGYVLVLIGVIWYEVIRRNGMSQSIWVYILMLGGSIVVISGLVLITGFFLNKNST